MDGRTGVAYDVLQRYPSNMPAAPPPLEPDYRPRPPSDRDR